MTISTAYIYGLNFCTGDFVIIMDADFSHHVSQVILLVVHYINTTDSRNLYPNSLSKSFMLVVMRYVIFTRQHRLQQAYNLDIVTGTRYRSTSTPPMPGGLPVVPGGVHGWDLKRKLVSRGANFLADTVLNPGVSDLTGSFRYVAKSTFHHSFNPFFS